MGVNYSTFGVQMDGRKFVVDDYRYHFNGKESDEEVQSGGNVYYYDARALNALLGRWMSKDPIYHADASPYNSFNNTPIYQIDPDGKDAIVTVDKATQTVTVTTTVYYWEPRNSEGTYTGPVTTTSAAQVTGMNTLQNATLPWDQTFNIDMAPAGSTTSEPWAIKYSTVFVPIQANDVKTYETKAQNQVAANPGSDYILFVDVAPGTLIDKYGDPTSTASAGSMNISNGAYGAASHLYTVNIQSSRPLEQTFGHEEGHALGFADASADPNSPFTGIPGNSNTAATGPIMTYALSRTVSIDEATRQATASINLAKATAGDTVTILQPGGSGPGQVNNPNVTVQPPPSDQK
jgi:RHS repeat-associated protein